MAVCHQEIAKAEMISFLGLEEILPDGWKEISNQLFSIFLVCKSNMEKAFTFMTLLMF